MSLLEHWNIYIYIWCNKEQLYDYIKYFVVERNCNFELFVWHKTNVPPFTSGHFLKDKELCLCFWEKGKIKISGKYGDMITVFESTKNLKDKKLYEHPTIKPLEYIKRMILNSSNENDIVLDPFAGSGTTAVACKELNRNFIGFEINKEYYDIAIDRINGISQKSKKEHKGITLF